MSIHYGAGRVRSGLGWFAIGKLATAVLGLLIFSLVVRALGVADYAIYVSLIAAMEMAHAVTSFGVDWVAARYLPEYRERGSARQLRGLCRLLVVWRIVTLAPLVLLALLIPAGTAAAIGVSVDGSQLVLIAIWFVLIEGVFRFVIGSLFEPLLWQGMTQAGLLARNGTLVLMLIIASMAGSEISILQLVKMETMAAAIGALFCLMVLLFRLGADRSSGDPDFQEPAFGQMASIAGHNYVSGLLLMPVSPPFLLLVCGRFLAPIELASLGFARNFADLVRRYMPSEMLHGMIRPVLISAFVRTRQFAVLNDLCLLVWKCSALMLVPVIGALAVAGPEIVSLMSGGKYANASLVATVLCGLLLLRFHAVQLATMVNAVNQPHLMTWAAVASMASLVPFVMLLNAGAGMWSFVATVALQEVIQNFVLSGGLRRVGAAYRFDWSSAARLGVGLLVVCTAAVLMPRPDGPWMPTVVAMAAALLSLAIAIVAGTFTPLDRARIRRIAVPDDGSRGD